MDTTLLKLFQQTCRELRLQQGITARQRHAAAMTEKRLIFEHLLQKLFKLNLTCIPDKRSGRTDLHDPVPVLRLQHIELQRMIRVKAHAAMTCRFITHPAMNAFLCEVNRAPAQRNPFRIMAPCTLQRTALKKNGRAYPVTIMR